MQQHKTIPFWKMRTPNPNPVLKSINRDDENYSPHEFSEMSRYYLCTLSANKRVLSPHVLPDNMLWFKGQLEISASGFLHWQFVICTKTKCRASAVKKHFPAGHVEVSRSEAANEYVWKEDTSVPGTRFELGKQPLSRARERDWDQIWTMAKEGKYDSIPADIRVRCYTNLKKIRCDFLQPQPIEKVTSVFVGSTGTGKSRTAWAEATFSAYPKNPNSKFWDGYRGQKHVIIDEFRGRIDISYLLLWLDRYPCIVEIKGSSVPLEAEKIWITSNLHPSEWYPGLDDSTKDALLRRLNITIFRKLQ